MFKKLLHLQWVNKNDYLVFIIFFLNITLKENKAKIEQTVRAEALSTEESPGPPGDTCTDLIFVESHALFWALQGTEHISRDLLISWKWDTERSQFLKSSVC